MLLQLSTWQETEAFLERSKTIVIPIGSNEQHGPTGLLGTDWLCPEIIAHEAQKSAGILIAPTFNVGMAQHHLDFPGTIALTPSTFMAAIGDWAHSLAHHGFTRLFFLNGHGGNVASMEAAFPPWPFRKNRRVKPWWASECAQSPIAAMKVEGVRAMVPGKSRWCWAMPTLKVGAIR